MYLNEGIDTGHIIHQIRPLIYPTDSFHQLSNRFLINAFNTYAEIIENFKSINNILNINSFNKSIPNKVYKMKDFTEDSLNQLHKNFKSEMLIEYLNDKEKRDKKVPIIEAFKNP